MKEKTAKLFKITIFIVYIAATLYFLFFAGEMGRGRLKEDYTYNLELFKEITRFINWAKVSEVGFRAMLINVVGNIACFVPFGILLPMNVKRFRSFASVMLMTFTVSLVVEIVQLVTRTGAFDVDDILLNTIGGVLGYLAYKILVKTKQV